MANRYAVETAFNLIDNATKPLNKIGVSSSVVGKGIKKNFVEAQLRVDNFGKTVAKVTDVVKKAAFAAQGVAIAAAGAFVVSGVKGAVEFQKNMEKVGAQANLTREQITGFTSDLISLSNKTGTAVSDLANAQLHAISNGVKVADSVQFLEVAQKAAKGGFMDVSKVIDSLTSALKSYGLEASSAGKISDQMMAAARAGGVSFEDMATKLEKVLPVASKFGVSSDKLFASIATLTSQGVPIADAAKKIKSALEKDGSINIFDKNEAVKFNEILNQITGSAGATNEAFSRVDRTISEQWNSALNKIKNTGLKLGMALLPVIQKIIDKISLFVDKFSDMDFGPFVTQIEATVDRVLNSFDFEKIVSGMQGFFTTLSNVFSMVTGLVELFFKFKGVIMAVGIGGFVMKRVFDGLVIGKNILGFAKDVTEGFKIAERTARGAASGFAFASERAQAVSKAMGGIRKIGTEVSEIASYIGHMIKMGVVTAATAIKNTALAVSQTVATAATTAFTAAQAALNAVFIASPIGWIVLGIIALIAIIVLLVKNWDTVVAALKKAFSAIGNFFVMIWEGIKSFFVKVVDFVKRNALNILNVILGILFFPAGVIMAVVRLIITHWDKIKEALLSVWEGIKAVFGKVKDFIGGVFNKVKEGAGKAWEGIKSGAGAAWEGIKTGAENLKNGAIETFNKLKDGAGAAFNKAKELGGAAWEGIKEYGFKAWGQFENRFPGLANVISIVFNKIKDIISGIIENIKAIFNGFKNFFIGLWDALKEGPAATLEYIKNAFFGLFDKIKEKFFGFIDVIKNGWETVKGFFGGIGEAVGNVFSGNKKTNVSPQVQNIVPPALNQTATATAGMPYNMTPNINRNNQTITAAATPATRPMTTGEQYSYSQTTNREEVDIAVRADKGTQARVTRQPRSPNVRVAASGGN